MQVVCRDACRVNSLNLIYDGYSSDNVSYEERKGKKKEKKLEVQMLTVGNMNVKYNAT